MLKKKRGITTLFFLLVSTIGFVYGNFEFLEGHIFAEMSMENSPSIKKNLFQTEKEEKKLPVIQKLKIGEDIQTDLAKLVKGFPGKTTKLKHISAVNSTVSGFKWAKATVIDSDFKEESINIPVTVYDDQTTIFDDVNNIALDVKNNIELSLNEVTVAIQENYLNELILERSNAASFQTDNGEKVNITLGKQDVLSQIGDYEVSVQAIKKGTTDFVEKRIIVTVKDDSLNDGWEPGTITDNFENDGYKIEWNKGAWWYTHNGNKWMFMNSIDANLIINGKIPSSGSDKFNGFLWSNTSSSTFRINKETKSISRKFDYLKVYEIEIIQKLLDNNSVEIIYQVTNRTGETQKIGLSQFVDTFVGSDFVPVTPINNFKGINLTSGDYSLAIIPDKETMPNWAAGSYPYTDNFKQYDVQNYLGIGWETGLQYRTFTGGLNRIPVELKENKPVNVGDSAVSMKNQGVETSSKETVSFKQTLKFGKLLPPKVTLNQTALSMFQHEEVIIDGTISSDDNHSYELFLEMDDKDKSLISLSQYNDIPYGEIQKYESVIKGSLFSKGKHIVSIIGIDQYGARSEPLKLELMISELSAVAKIQKIQVGEPISNDIKTLFTEIKGESVSLKNPLTIDSSVVGFQWLETILVDKNQHEIKINIPVNIYNPESTVFHDSNKIALDSKNASFKIVDINQAIEDNKLNELVFTAVNPQSWDISDGTMIPVTLTRNEIKPIFGSYNAGFTAVRRDNGLALEKISQLDVGGELKFKHLPKSLDFKKTKLNTKNSHVEREDAKWKIEIENTIVSNWSLTVTASPFEDELNEESGHTLVFKDDQNEDKTINSIPQKIASGKTESFPIIQWDTTTGLLVKLKPGAKNGFYKGLINWTLEDAP